MSKFINIVKVTIKDGSEKKYLKKVKNKENFDGLISSKHLMINSNTYYMIEEWKSEEALLKARKSIEISDQLKPIIKDQSSIVEVTSLINGPVIKEEEKGINYFGTNSLDIKKKQKTSQLHNFNDFLKSFMKIH